jgi:hypothetical protein
VDLLLGLLTTVTIAVLGDAVTETFEATVAVATTETLGSATAVRDATVGFVTCRALYFFHVVKSDAAPFSSGIY